MIFSGTRTAIVLLLALVAAAPNARAEDKSAAKQAYAEGSKYYDLNQYSEALEAFKRAYWNFENPAILYNIAQCHRALGHKKEAIDFYRSYLRKAADARNRDDVQRMITELDSAIEKEKLLSMAPPRGTMTSEPKAVPVIVEAPRPTPTPIPLTPVAAVVVDAPHAKPRYWIVGVVIGGVVVAGLAVGLGVGLGTATHAPNADGTVSF